MKVYLLMEPIVEWNTPLSLHKSLEAAMQAGTERYPNIQWITLDEQNCWTQEYQLRDEMRADWKFIVMGTTNLEAKNWGEMNELLIYEMEL